MKYVGIDLHKETISVCVVDQARQVESRARFCCFDTKGIGVYFEHLRPFQMVVEATGGYLWLFKLLEPLAERAVLAHPKKLRIIAESTRKSDRLDAQVLAEFLAVDMIPRSYRPTPRQREHRRLVRRRIAIQSRITSAVNRVHRLLSDYNADLARPLALKRRPQLAGVQVSEADRFLLDQFSGEYDFHRAQLREVDERLDQFLEQAPAPERRNRELLRSIPGVGKITTEVVLSELAGPERFRSQKDAVAYAGLAPGQRESAGKAKQLGIEKTGSKHLRWVLVEAAWQLVRYSPGWRTVYERLKRRLKAKKAIVAIARRLLTMMVAILKSGKPYRAELQEAINA